MRHFGNSLRVLAAACLAAVWLLLLVIPGGRTVSAASDHDEGGGGHRHATLQGSAIVEHTASDDEASRVSLVAGEVGLRPAVDSSASRGLVPGPNGAVRDPVPPGDSRRIPTGHRPRRVPVFTGTLDSATGRRPCMSCTVTMARTSRRALRRTRRAATRRRTWRTSP